MNEKFLVTGIQRHTGEEFEYYYDNFSDAQHAFNEYRDEPKRFKNVLLCAVTYVILQGGTIST